MSDRLRTRAGLRDAAREEVRDVRQRQRAQRVRVAAHAVARVDHRLIDGDAQRLAAGALHPLNQVLRDRAVAVDVELKPERLRRRGGHRFDGAVGIRAEHHDRRRGARAAGGGHFALRMHEHVRRGRREQDRMRERPAEQRRGGVDRLDVDHHAAFEAQPLKRLAIPPHGEIVGAALVVVFPRRNGDQSPGSLFVLRDAEQVGVRRRRSGGGGARRRRRRCRRRLRARRHGRRGAAGGEGERRERLAAGHAVRFRHRGRAVNIAQW